MKFEIRKAKNGSLIPVINDFLVHSLYFPEKQGEKTAKKFLEEIEKKEACLVVLGCGFGYHIFPLIREYEKIYIFEPSKEILSEIENLFESEKVEFIENIGEISTEEYNVFEYLPLKRVFPEEFQNFYKKEVSYDSSEIRILIDFPIYGGSETIAKYLLAAFENENFQVEFIDNTELKPFFKRILSLENNELKNELSNDLTEMTSKIFYEKVIEFRPDICLFNAQSPIDISTIKKIREDGIFTIFSFVEDYKRFNYWEKYAKEIDLFWTIQKGEFHRKLAKFGANHFFYLPMAASKKYHRIIEKNDNDREIFGSDISFMGAGYINRHLFFQELLEYDLKIWGNDWIENKKIAPKVMKNGERVSIEEISKIYNYSKININLHSSNDNRFFEEDGDFVNPRTFEILACGGFQLVDERILLPEIFEDGVDLVTFNSLEDLKRKIDFYLENPEKREIIRRNGQKKVLENHLYKNRIKSLIQASLSISKNLKRKITERQDRKAKNLAQISDKHFMDFIKKYPLEKYSLEELIAILNEKNKKFENFEIILNILQTFYNGD